MFFSIIIPVYNAEKTLEKCLNSLREQDFKDYEVLLIDDGSQDGSFAVCREFAEKDTRFLPVHQENRGPSAARNEGLKRAAGKYLCFVDSDDYVVPGYLSLLYAKLRETKADAIFFGYHKVDREGRILKTRLPPTEPERYALMAALSRRDMFGYTWIKCFSREIAGESRFPEDMSLFEDEVFTCSVLEKTKSVAVLAEALYCYRCDGADMLTGRTYPNYCELSDRVFSAWERLMQNAPDREAVLQKKADAFVGRCRHYGLERDVDVLDFFGSLSQTCFFRRHSNWNMLDRFVRSGNRLGMRITILLYRLKNKIRKSG